jgi:lysophospholipase L1-like esterase
MKTGMRVAAVAVLMTAWAAVAWGEQAKQGVERDPQRFSKEIEAFEAKDRQNMPEPGGILFVGSSSIRIWKTDEAFPGKHVINRGFGGSHISDSIAYANRIILPYKPKLIVFYAGDNDIAAGKSPERVVGDFKTLLGMIHDALPETKVVYIDIKPSISRWKLHDKMDEVNRGIAEMAEKDPLLTTVSIEKEMLGADGKPRPELFRPDGLHMSDKGYEIWNKKLRPYVEAAAGGR